MVCSFDSSTVSTLLGACLVLATGCPADESEGGAGSSSSDTTSESEAGTWVGTDSEGSSGASASSTSQDSETGTGSETGTITHGDTTGGALECEDDPVPEEEASILTITVELTNDTEASVFVLEDDEGAGCTAVTVEREDVELPQQTSGTCGCECPGPQSALFSSVALEPGATRTYTWDGRALTPYEVREACFADECSSERSGVPQRVAAGRVALTMGLYEEAAEMEDQGQYGFQTRCSSPRTFSVDVLLGEDDETIAVAVSEL